MDKYAVIENGKVINTVRSEAGFAAEQGWIVCPEEVAIDWDYTNGQFVDTRPIPPASEPPPAPTKEDLLAQLQALQAQINALA